LKEKEEKKKTTTELTSTTRPMSVEETQEWLRRLDAAKPCKEIPEKAKRFIEECKKWIGEKDE